MNVKDMTMAELYELNNALITELAKRRNQEKTYIRLFPLRSAKDNHIVIKKDCFCLTDGNTEYQVDISAFTEMAMKFEAIIKKIASKTT